MTFRKLFGRYVVGVVYNLCLDDRKLFLGPARWPRWVLALLPFSRLFNDAAKTHDEGYADKLKIKSRKLIDKAFYRDMKRAIQVSDLHPTVELCARIAAIKYYCLVRFFGGFFFNIKNGKN